jgi:hypothetical protein
MAEVTKALETLLAAGHTLDEIEMALRQMRQDQVVEALGNEAADALLKMFNRHWKRRRYARGGGE